MPTALLLSIRITAGYLHSSLLLLLHMPLMQSCSVGNTCRLVVVVLLFPCFKLLQAPLRLQQLLLKLLQLTAQVLLPRSAWGNKAARVSSGKLRVNACRSMLLLLLLPSLQPGG